LQVINAEPSKEKHAIVNPFKLLCDLQKACFFPCILQKVLVKAVEGTGEVAGNSKIDSSGMEVNGCEHGAVVDETRFVVLLYNLYLHFKSTLLLLVFGCRCLDFFVKSKFFLCSV